RRTHGGPCAAEHQTSAARRIDDPEEHAERRRFAGAVGPEQAIDRAGRNGEADAVHRAGFVEVLDELDGLDGQAILNPFVLSLSKHCFPLRIKDSPSTSSGRTV